MSALLSATSLRARAIYHLLYSVPDHRIHHHIEDGGVQRVPLCNPPELMKCRPVVAS